MLCGEHSNCTLSRWRSARYLAHFLINDCIRQQRGLYETAVFALQPANDSHMETSWTCCWLEGVNASILCVENSCVCCYQLVLL